MSYQHCTQRCTSVGNPAGNMMTKFIFLLLIDISPHRVGVCAYYVNLSFSCGDELSGFSCASATAKPPFRQNLFQLALTRILTTSRFALTVRFQARPDQIALFIQDKGDLPPCFPQYLEPIILLIQPPTFRKGRIARGRHSKSELFCVVKI